MSDRSECPGYDAHIEECARCCICCRCCHRVCDGVLAGGMCDEMDCVHGERWRDEEEQE